MTRSHSTRRGIFSSALVVGSVLGVVIMLHAVGLAVVVPAVARAQSGDELLEQKAYWQGRYRTLLQNAARLRNDAEKSREDYARARRRNYPRGGARRQFIIDAEAAEEKLERMTAAIAEIIVEARRDLVPHAWLYEVEDEAIDLTPPASASQESTEAREGRNPLYLGDDDDI